MWKFLVVLGIGAGLVVDTAPLPKNATVPPMLKYVNPYKDRVLLPQMDEASMKEEKCDKTPFEWPEVEVSEHLFIETKGRIHVSVRSWLPLTFVWQRSEEVVWYEKQLYSYGVPLPDSSPHHQIKTYRAGNEYETELNVIRNVTSHDTVTWRNVTSHDTVTRRYVTSNAVTWRYGLVIYITHPCHQVAINIKNLEKLAQNLKVYYPEIDHFPRSVYELAKGENMNLEILMKDENPSNPKVIPWMKLYERRGRDVRLPSFEKRRSLTTFDHSEWHNNNEDYIISTEMFLNQVGHREAGLYGMIYTQDIMEPVYDIFVYSEIKIGTSYPALNIYSCSSVHKPQELTYGKIGIPQNRLNCLYCIACYAGRKPRVVAMTMGNEVSENLQSASYISLGESYHLAQYPLDSLGSGNREVKCSMTMNGRRITMRKKLIPYTDAEVLNIMPIASSQRQLKLLCNVRGTPKPTVEFYSITQSNLANLVNNASADVINHQKKYYWTRLRSSRDVTITHAMPTRNNSQSVTLTLRKRGGNSGRGRHKLSYICLAKNEFSQSFELLRAPW